MANSIAFSVGNGGGGSIIKSIQRGESPIYTLHGKYQSSNGISHTDHFHVESIKIPISPVNPAKSIVLLSPVFMPVTDSSYSDDISYMRGAISLADFQSTYFTCKIGYEYLSNELGPNQQKYGYNYYTLCVTDKYDGSGAPIESTIRLRIDIDDIASVSYWIENNYDGVLSDGDDVEITCDGAKVSYQIIEFY